MYELNANFTEDGSVGLYSKDADDIYHSTRGALSESYEKFILPLNLKNYFDRNNEVKILDICFGIGYNTKSFINNFLENIYNETIDTDNIIYNDKLYTDNKKFKIFIHAVDNDKILALLSPFFITNKNFYFNNKKIKRFKCKYKIKKETNIILLNLLKKYIDIDIFKIINSHKYAKYFDHAIIDFKAFKNITGNNSYPLYDKMGFLHNIYYQYLSVRHKNAMKYLNNIDFNFKLSIDDARQIIKKDKNIYNFIFLDAFSPSKCPSLWTLEFFRELYNRIDYNGVLITYSSAPQVRSAMLAVGFNIAKIIIEEKSQGTVATKSKICAENFDKIFNNQVQLLSEFDLGLLKTRAGIFYRDEKLNLPNEAIIKLHKCEVENSKLISSTKFIKINKNK